MLNMNTILYYSLLIFYLFIIVFSSVGNGIEYRIKYSILSNSKFLNLTDIRKCRKPKYNYSKMLKT